MSKKATFKRITYRDTFTRREMARLAFLRFLIATGRVNEGD